MGIGALAFTQILAKDQWRLAVQSGFAFTVAACVAEGLVLRAVHELCTHAFASVTAKLIRTLTGLLFWTLTRTRVFVKLLRSGAVVVMGALTLAGRFYPHFAWTAGFYAAPTTTSACLWI